MNPHWGFNKQRIQMKYKLLLIFVLVSFVACKMESNDTDVNNKETTESISNTEEMKLALRKHLNAVTNKNIDTLKITIPKENETMFLMLPDGAKMSTSGEFLKMHADWFLDTISKWHIDFEIKYVYRNDNLGYSLVEAMLTEPERNGKPYFHKMHVSYVLEKRDNKWLVIKDHASSIEKSE